VGVNWCLTKKRVLISYSLTMIAISFVRVLRNALQNFQRNVWLSIATTIIMTLTLIVILFLYFMNVLGSEVLQTIERKIDLSAVLAEEVNPQQIQIIADDLTARADVQEVRVVSSEEALAIFRQRHEDEPFFEESLRELEANPLPATMYIIATEPRFYENIARQLESEAYRPHVAEVNFENSRHVIDRLIVVLTGVRNVGVITTLVLASLVILIMFNTIRLAIYSFREEIDIMRLVGASNWFIRGPFILEAMLVALLSVVLCTLIVFPILRTVSPQVERFFFAGEQTFSIYNYALANWGTVIGLQLLASLALAVMSSMIAIRRYLR